MASKKKRRSLLTSIYAPRGFEAKYQEDTNTTGRFKKLISEN